MIKVSDAGGAQYATPEEKTLTIAVLASLDSCVNTGDAFKFPSVTLPGSRITVPSFTYKVSGKTVLDRSVLFIEESLADSDLGQGVDATIAAVIGGYKAHCLYYYVFAPSFALNLCPLGVGHPGRPHDKGRTDRGVECGRGSVDSLPGKGLGRPCTTLCPQQSSQKQGMNVLIALYSPVSASFLRSRNAPGCMMPGKYVASGQCLCGSTPFVSRRGYR